MHAVGEASSSVALPGTICADLATLINGVSIAVRQNLYVISSSTTSVITYAGVSHTVFYCLSG